MTKTTADIILQDLQAKYPHPRRPVSALGEGPPTLDDYCVGGALCLFLHPDDPNAHFPTVSQLADVLQDANPRLAFKDAWDRAVRIVTTNDEGLYTYAWRLLGYALKARR